jgi:hypothetical protein
VAGSLPIGILSAKEKLLRAMKKVKNRGFQKHDFIPKRIFSATELTKRQKSQAELLPLIY